MRKRTIHILTALVSLSVLMYIQLYLPYTSHVHIIGGMKIVHAHPFSNDKNHDHDAASLLVIDLVSHQPAIVSTTPNCQMPSSPSCREPAFLPR